jgi:hypothetical protein
MTAALGRQRACTAADPLGGHVHGGSGSATAGGVRGALPSLGRVSRPTLTTTSGVGDRECDYRYSVHVGNNERVLVSAIGGEAASIFSTPLCAASSSSIHSPS